MSGIVGILNLDSSPVDSQVLARMAGALAFRAPDGVHTWLNGQIGLGHAWLQTASGLRSGGQPASLDGRFWIVADARIDGQDDLRRKLAVREEAPAEAANDAQLILRAYRVWAEDCVHHLIGDFAFAIWDAERRSLFCARDHFGIKQLYYAHTGSHLVFSNTLDCVRLHPAVSAALDDRSIADFLLFGYDLEADGTPLADIRRLPQGHCLIWSEGGLRCWRYWALPTNGAVIRYRRAEEYVEQFQAILKQAVQDRLRTDRAGILLSGGLDSSTVAAKVRHLAGSRQPPLDVHAFTVVYDRLIPDQERHYTDLAAAALEIPAHYTVADGYGLFEQWPYSPVPVDDPHYGVQAGLFRQITDHNIRVILTGQGGDEVLYPTGLLGLVGAIPLSHLAADIVRSVVRHRKRPPTGLIAGPARALRRQGITSWAIFYPEWLDPGLEARLELKSRWRQMWFHETPAAHPTRPDAYRRLTLPAWHSALEFWDAGVTRMPAEVRYPFLDLRLVSYLLSIPPIPWCVDKELLRVAARGVLPDEVRLRRKTPLIGDPIREKARALDSVWMERVEWTPLLHRYVDVSRIPSLPGLLRTEGDVWSNLRPVCLNHWLATAVAPL